jgi:hypothetical protein
MPSPIGLLRASMLAFLVGLAGFVIYLALTGRLGLRGLLDVPGTAGLDQRRLRWAGVQLLIVSALALGYLLIRWAGVWGPSPAFMIGGTLVLAASHAVYLRSVRRQLDSKL